MPVAKIAITLEGRIVRKLDRLVRQKVFPNRSKAIQEAVKDKIKRYDCNRLEKECKKLDPKYEQALAEEGMTLETEEWPEY